MKKSLLALILILCLVLCSCAPDISSNQGTEPSGSESTAASAQPTESATQPTESTTQPTEPPVTEPTIPVPDGTPLSDDELASMQELFQWPSHYTVVSHNSFATPAERPLSELLREGPEMEKLVTMSEAEKAHLSAISEGFLYVDTYRISKEEAARVLDQYYGLTLTDIPDVGSMVYWEKTDCFYICHSDTARRDLTVTHAVTLEDGTVWVRYCDARDPSSTGEMILKPTDSGYQIISNQTS